MFGFCSLIFVECLNGAKRLTSVLPASPPLQGILGGCLLLGIAWLASPEVLGLGKDTIQRALEGGIIVWALILGKILTTALTLNTGGSGGLSYPSVLSEPPQDRHLVGYSVKDPSLFAALGLTGLLAGAINTPITAVILGLELFGLSSGPYLLLSCTIAFVLSGHRSAIPTQLLQFTKAPALQASLNKEIGELERTQTETEKNMREETNKTRKG